MVFVIHGTLLIAFRSDKSTWSHYKICCVTVGLVQLFSSRLDGFLSEQWATDSRTEHIEFASILDPSTSILLSVGFEAKQCGVCQASSLWIPQELI